MFAQPSKQTSYVLTFQLVSAHAQLCIQKTIFKACLEAIYLMVQRLSSFIIK